MTTGTLNGTVSMPHRTVSLEVDYDRGVLRIYSDANPHRHDWAMALSIAAEAAPGCRWDYFMDECTDIYEIRLT